MEFAKKTLLGILPLSLLTAALASAQIISISSGDGQVAPQNFAAQAPMVAIVKSAQGQPLAVQGAPLEPVSPALQYYASSARGPSRCPIDSRRESCSEESNVVSSDPPRVASLPSPPET